jgi:hypothetical protein
MGRLCVTSLLIWLAPMLALAHGVAEGDASFVEANQGAAVIEFLYLGAKHMVTGYDHLLFLAAVIFFLYRLRDVVTYATLFTLGHSITLLAGVLGGIHANPYIVDAIIGFSIVYKAFDNLGGFRQFLGFEPNPKLAVMIFGLFHGFGLATKLQALNLSSEGLIVNIVSFNVGVELGQALALTAILLVFVRWRAKTTFLHNALLANTVIMACGFILMGYQITGYLVE